MQAKAVDAKLTAYENIAQLLTIYSVLFLRSIYNFYAQLHAYLFVVMTFKSSTNRHSYINSAKRIVFDQL